MKCHDIARLRLCLAAQGITLRRVKTQLINGKPIVVLPSKTTNIVELEFSDKVRQVPACLTSADNAEHDLKGLLDI